MDVAPTGEGAGTGTHAGDGDGIGHDAPLADLADRGARGAGIILVTQVGRVLLQFCSVVLLARLLTPEDFGLVAMVTAVVGLAEIIREAGLSSAAVQATHLSEDQRVNLFWANLGLGTACAVVILAAKPLIVAAYHEPRLGPIVLSLAFTFVVSGANTQYRADLMRRLRFRQLSTSNLSAQFVATVVAIGMAWAGAGLWAIVAQNIVNSAAAFAINVVNVRWMPGLPRRHVSILPFMRFGVGVLGTNALAYLAKSATSIAIGTVYGPVPLGLYNRSYQLLMTPLQQIDAQVTDVVLPVLSRVNADREVFQRYLARTQMVACYVTSVVLAVAAGLATPLILVLFGPRWSQMSGIFVVLAVGGVFRTLGQVAYWIFLARGRTGAQLKLDMVMRPIMVAIMLGGLPWGVVGVAWGHGVAFFLYWVLAYLWCARTTGTDVRPLFRAALRTIVMVSAPCGLAAWAAALLTGGPPELQLVAGVAGSFGWMLVAFALFPTVRADLTVGRAIVRRALRPGAGPTARAGGPVTASGAQG